MSQSKESSAGSVGLVANIEQCLEDYYDSKSRQSWPTELLQRARDRIVELESSMATLESPAECEVHQCAQCGATWPGTREPQADPELQEVDMEIVATRRCPKCWTYGHQHKKDCPYAGKGMEHYVPI